METEPTITFVPMFHHEFEELFLLLKFVEWPDTDETLAYWMDKNGSWREIEDIDLITEVPFEELPVTYPVEAEWEA